MTTKSRILLVFPWVLAACLPKPAKEIVVVAPADGNVDVRFAASDCSRPFSASDFDPVAAAAIERFRTSDLHAPCPGLGCDSSLAIPWCGPFGRVDGGFDWAGGLFASDDLSVLNLGAFASELYFAAPHVADPRLVPQRRIDAHVIIPDRVGPFQTTATGLSMVRLDGGFANPPVECLAEFADTKIEIRIPNNWRYFWRPSSYNGWARCGPVVE